METASQANSAMPLARLLSFMEQEHLGLHTLDPHLPAAWTRVRPQIETHCPLLGDARRDMILADGAINGVVPGAVSYDRARTLAST
jgi:hypothetical protein